MLLHEIQKTSLKNEYARFWALDRGLETPKNRFARGLGNILISISEIDGDWERFRWNVGIIFHFFFFGNAEMCK